MNPERLGKLMRVIREEKELVKAAYGLSGEFAEMDAETIIGRVAASKGMAREHEAILKTYHSKGRR